MAILRVGCYERVSTDEQALRGFSIDAQIDNLTDYCVENNLKLVGHYTDAGKSGSLPPLKRPALQQLLDDVQAGKIDIILFTKLDRWFRSVKEYFKVQEILDNHKVEWKAIHEDYDTTTANGRMAITIFLAVAQNEREKASERIKVVLEHKRKNKEACFAGTARPFGYMREKDADGIYRLVKNPEEKQMCEDFWKVLIEDNNFRMITRYMYNVHGIKKDISVWRHISRQPFYYGSHYDVEDYCEPYISKADWDKVQACNDAKVEKSKLEKQNNKENNIYLFLGMMHCPKCGRLLTSSITKSYYKDKKYIQLIYRCRLNNIFCNYGRSLSERTLEKMLLQKLPELIQKEIAASKMEMTAQNAKPKHNIAGLRERLRTLNASYMAGNKTDEEYVTESAEIKELIAKAEQEVSAPERDLSPLMELLNDNFPETYSAFGKEKKRTFWQTLLKEIIVEDNKIVDVVFKY